MKEELRKKLKIGTIAVLIIFLVIYCFVLLTRYTNQQNKNVLSSNAIIFSQPDLKVFSDTYTLNTFPDRVQMHYPYFFVVQPEKLTTTIYNIQTKKKEKIISQVLLDYSNGDTVYNDNGYNTFVSGKNIGLFCDQAFIVSKEEVLCVIRPDKKLLQNKLITINPQTIATHDLYSSQNVITAIYHANSTLYIAEYDFQAKKSYIVVNGEKAEAPDLINTFYQMTGQIYVASFKGVRNNSIESFDLVTQENGKLIIKQKGKKEIVFDE